MQGFICTQLAMNMCRTDIERGICGVMGAVLAIQGAAWGLAVGHDSVLYACSREKKASEQVAVGGRRRQGEPVVPLSSGIQKHRLIESDCKERKSFIMALMTGEQYIEMHP